MRTVILFFCVKFDIRRTTSFLVLQQVAEYSTKMKNNHSSEYSPKCIVVKDRHCDVKDLNTGASFTDGRRKSAKIKSQNVASSNPRTGQNCVLQVAQL